MQPLLTILAKKASCTLLVGLLASAVSACGVGGIAQQPTAVPPTAAPTSVPPTAAPTAVPPTPTPAGIASVDDVQNAVLYIEVDGGIIPLGETNAVSNAGSGSGFIIDPSGIAVTNNHVVTGASTITVHIGGKKKDPTGTPAKVLGISECSDLAVIQILSDKKDYPFLRWYDGEIKNLLKVIAVGFPLDAPSIDTTRGSISQLDVDGQTSWASLAGVLEHDARLNPGNSGGPLITEDAQVVGINYAGDSKDNTYFAIGRDEAKNLIETLKKGDDSAALGINGEAFAEDTIKGVWVRSVKPGSPASGAGIKPGDIITSLYNTTMGEDGTMQKYCQVLHSHPGEAVNVEVIRPSSKQILEGEINSKNAGLRVTGSFDEPTAEPTAPEAYTDFQTITHTSGAISMEVPSTWAEVRNDNVWKLDDKQVGVEIAAFPSSDKFQDWSGPGIAVLASRSLAKDTTPDQLLDRYKFDDDCTNAGRTDQNIGDNTGRLDVWKNCKGSDTSLAVLAFEPPDKSYICVVQFQLVSKADSDIADRVINSIKIQGDF